VKSSVPPNLSGPTEGRSSLYATSLSVNLCLTYVLKKYPLSRLALDSDAGAQCRQAYSLFVSIDMLTMAPASDPRTRWEDGRLLSVVTMVPATTDDLSARLLVSTKTILKGRENF
jgi:hypothetical protein